jgi:hypothetical protein
MNLKTIILSYLMCVCLASKGQISVGANHVGAYKSIKKETLKTFKGTETIFLFSDVYPKSVYEEVLRNAWTVTPYKIVSAKDFNLSNYLNGKYSFAMIGGHKIERAGKYGGSTTYLYTYFDLFLYDVEDKKAELERVAKKSEKRIEKYDITANHQIALARFYLFPKNEFINKVIREPRTDVAHAMQTEDMFYNYQPGFLRNYLQKISTVLSEEKSSSLYANSTTPGLAALKTETLIVPEYITKRFNPLLVKSVEKANEGAEAEERQENLFEKYDFKYKFESDETVNWNILKGHNFYYLRYVRMNTERFLQVVHSLTGEVVYADYIPGIAYHLKANNLLKLSNWVKHAK